MNGITSYVIGPCFNLLIESVLVLIPERRISNQENVEDHTCNTHTHKEKDENRHTHLRDPIVTATGLVTPACVCA